MPTRNYVFKILSQEYDDRFRFDKLLQYKIFDVQNNEEPLQLLAKFGVIYMKNLSSNMHAALKTMNFSSLDDILSTQEVYLVLQSFTFNFSRKIRTNIFLLCSSNILTHYFIVSFSTRHYARRFFLNSSVKDNINEQIPCSAEWLPSEVFQQIPHLL